MSDFEIKIIVSCISASCVMLGGLQIYRMIMRIESSDEHKKRK